MKQLSDDALTQYLQHELDPAFARRAKLLVQELRLTGKEKVLEVGCGRGYYEGLLSHVFPDLKITAIDRSDTYLAIAKQRVSSRHVTFMNADALNLPWKTNSFDRVFATEVLEHLPDDEKGLSEMYRVLKPGGIAVVTVPNKNYPFWWDPLNWTMEKTLGIHVSKDIWWLAGIWADHVRLYDQQDLVSKAKVAGFKVQNLFFSTHHSIPFEHFLLYGIGKNIVESGFLPGFYRFNPTNNPSRFFEFIRSITYAKDYKNRDTESSSTPTVNLILSMKKMD